MRSVPLIVTILFLAGAVFASEIREFDLETIERLGNELTRVSQRPDRGATDAIRRKAIQTAMKAARNKLNAAYGARYDFEVLNDPAGSGFLVYALAAFPKTNLIHTGGHLRITVSSDGEKAERIDELSHGITESDPVTEVAAIATAQGVETKYPVETWIYTSHLYHLPVAVATADGSHWLVVNGMIHKFTKAEMEAIDKEKKK